MHAGEHDRADEPVAQGADITDELLWHLTMDPGLDEIARDVAVVALRARTEVVLLRKLLGAAQGAIVQRRLGLSLRADGWMFDEATLMQRITAALAAPGKVDRG